VCGTHEKARRLPVVYHLKSRNERVEMSNQSTFVDLFGTPRLAYRGQPTSIQKPFTEEEVETITDDVVFNGFLLQDLADVLNKAKVNSKGSRKDLNEQLCWVFDLYASPPVVTFDVACDIEGVDAEHFRNAISVLCGDALRDLYGAVKAMMPSEVARVRKQLRGYVDLPSEDVVH